MIRSTGECGRDRCSLGIGLVIVDVEELKLVLVLVGGDDTEILAKVLLLEVLLGQVLEVSLGEGDLGLNDDCVLVLGNSDGLAEVADLAVDLDFLGKVGFEVVKYEDVVFDWVLAVDHISVAGLLGLVSLLSLLNHL